MAAIRSISNELSEDLARLAEVCGQCVVTLQPKDAHAVSGVAWQQKLVVTVNHAVRAEEVTVLFGEGKSAVAHLKGRDPSTDLAIFTLETDEATYAARGDAGQLRIGNFVLALARTRRGNLTASSGIISGVMGPWETWQGGQIDRFVRPDITLYRGYSGGPLVNARGEVVGINTSGIRRGTPVLIPTSTVTRVVDELVAKGHIARPYLGIALQPVPLPEDLVAKLNLTARYGLLIIHVENHSPASRDGLMLGDIVIEIAGQTIAPVATGHHLVTNHQVGESVAVGIVRSGEQRQILVTLGDRGKP